MKCVASSTLRAAGVSLLAAAALLVASPALAQTTYQNDGFVDGTAAGFQGGFIPGEMAAACFTPPPGDYPIRLQRMQFLFGGDRIGATVFQTMKVWTRGGDGAPPSNLVVSQEEVEVTAANDAFSEFDLTQFSLLVTEPFCVGIEFSNAGLPSVARDDDGSNARPGNNWIYASDGLGGFAWNQSILFGVQGDWIIRVIGTPSGGGTGNPDTGTPDTGTPDTGTPDAGTPTPDTGTPDAGTPDAGNATPVIFNVEQQGASPEEDIIVLIEGQNLRDSYRYRVGSASLDDIIANPNGQLVEGILFADDNPGPGTYDLEIRGDFPGTSVDERDAITIEPNPPQLSSITPTSLTLGSDQPVTITGTSLVGPITLLVGGQAVPGAVALNEQLITATIPGNLLSAPGAYPVLVTNAYGTAAPLTITAVEAPAEPAPLSSGCVATPTAPRSVAPLALLLLGLLVRRRRA